MKDTIMKKQYMKPEMQMLELKQNCHILAGSTDAFGMNTQLQDTSSSPADEVTDAW